MLDILGFKQLIRTTPASEIAQRVDQLFRGGSFALSWSRCFGGSGQIQTKRFHFSDTILMWTAPLMIEEDRHTAETMCLARNIADLLLHGFLSGLPIRGGIAFGESYIDEQRATFIGPAIVDAHETESQQNWIGAAVHPTADLGFSWLSELPFQRAVVPWHVPMKPRSGLAPELAIDWTLGMQMPFAHRTMRRLYKAAMGTYLQANMPADVLEKYTNTRSFADARLHGGFKEHAEIIRDTRRRHRLHGVPVSHIGDEGDTRFRNHRAPPIPKHPG